MTKKLSLLPPAVPAKREQNASSARYIAIVDDEEGVRQAFARLLRAYSFQAHTYGSGREFLDSLRTCVPACLIVDVHLGEMNGFDVLRCVTGMGIEIPAIVVTARNDSGVQHDFSLCNATALLVKPVGVDSLLQAIEIAISKSAGREARSQ